MKAGSKRKGLLVAEQDTTMIIATQLEDRHLHKNDDQQTPLAIAIRTAGSIENHLSEGAAVSIFVHGYFPGSLVCTLPMALQPPSRSFEHPPPLTNVQPDVIESIDKAMVDRIANLIEVKAAKAAKVANGINNVTTTGVMSLKDGIRRPSKPSSPSKKNVPAYDHYPSTLQVGDFVRRGPKWRWGNQDSRANGMPCVGIVKRAGGTTVVVEWGSDPNIFDYNPSNNDGYTYDASRGDFGLCRVDPMNQSVNPVAQGIITPTSSTTTTTAEKFSIGDKIRLGPNIKGSSLIRSNHELSIPKSGRFSCKSCGKSGPSGETGSKSCHKCEKCEKCCTSGSNNAAWTEKQFIDAGTVVLKNIQGSQNVIQSDYKIKFQSFGTSVGDIKLRATAEMKKYYYEVLSEDYKSSMQFGWITEGFKANPSNSNGKGVGDDVCGWAVDGRRNKKWHNGSSTQYGSQVSDGHIVGIAIDLEARTILASHNGDFSSPWGVAFTDITVPAGWVMPAMTAAEDAKYVVNFGDRPFKHQPPDETYLSVHAAHRVMTSLDKKNYDRDHQAKKRLDDECMGKSMDERVGIIVKSCVADVERSKEARTNCCKTGHISSRLNIVTVMSTATGVLCDYVEEDVVYADGSSADPLDPATTKPTAIGPESLPSATTRVMPLRFGDRVTLSSTFTANGGDGWCLGKQPQPTAGAAASAGGGSVSGATPVEGVVLFAPDSPFSTACPDQRDVLVAAVDDESKIYCFRSSWLNRSAIDSSRVFELGDRVQLANESPPLHAPLAPASTAGGGAAKTPSNKGIECDPRVDGKCLGKPSQSIYGRVVGVGVIREGIQRNIEVVAVGGPHNGQVSLYPAYVLLPAVRHTVMTNHDLPLLHTTVSHLLTSQSFPIDVDQLITTLGGNVWSRVLDLAISVKGIHKDVVVGAWEAWNRARDLSWPGDEPTLDAIEAIYDVESTVAVGPTTSLKMAGGQELAYRLPPPPPATANWTCVHPGCRFALNVPNKAKCLLCKQKAPKWQCTACTAENRPTAYACVACFTHRDTVNIAIASVNNTNEETSNKETRVLSAPFQRLAATAALETKARAELKAAARIAANPWSRPPMESMPVKKVTVLNPPKKVEVGTTFRVKKVTMSEAQALFSAAGNTFNPSMLKTFGQEGVVESYNGGNNVILRFGSPIDDHWSYPITMLELEEEVEVDVNDSDSDEDDDEEINGIKADSETELEKNIELAEAYFHGSEVDLGSNFVLPALSAGLGSSALGPISVVPTPPFALSRETSAFYVQNNHYEPIETIDALVNNADKNGNSAAHHAAMIGLTRTAHALFAAGASRWRTNNTHDTPQSALDGLPLGSGKERNCLYVAVTARQLLPQPLSCHVAKTADFAQQPPSEFAPLIAALLNPISGETEADYYSQKALQDNIPGAPLYRALFMLTFGFGEQQAKPLLDAYLQQLMTGGDNGDLMQSSTSIDPLYFYARYLVWKLQRSHAKAEKLMAADALQAFRLFDISSKFLISATDAIDNAGDNIDEQLASLGLLKPPEGNEAEEEEDAYAELIPPPGPDDPETLWDVAKKTFRLQSPAMDKLMALAGLKKVKQRALTVAMEVLTKNQRPPDQKPPTMNFLFVGNPGCGKTTVAELLATAMVELKYRANPTPICTSAGDILSGNDPGADFDVMVKKAEGGTLFVDEAYMFTPAPRGQRANDSNKVMDILLKVTESMRENTTFILAGYKEEIGQLLEYNQGFKSRFPKEFTFEFEDYSEAQLCQILCTMAKLHRYRFESQKTCGVPIARVLSRRIHRGAGKKGFGNGRLCEKILDNCKVAQTTRLGILKLRNMPISTEDYIILTRADTVGERPQLDSSAYYRQLMSMVGLHRVKEQMKSLINLQLQNFDSEMRGDKPQVISLHRVFFGNPGTGKTTVARLYGKLLKECGFLSDGDFVEVKPSDLKGQAVGEAATTTSAILESAKGKVLFIDEAYGLDPSRRSTNDFGGDVIDTLLEKIEGSAGQDLAVILAGYKPQMEELFRNCGNPGLKRRFNLEEGLFFEDFSDEELRKILKDLVVNSSLSVDPPTLDYAVKLISMRRRLDDFGNAGECSSLLDRAKMKLSSRKAKKGVQRPNHLIMEDFTGEETTAEKAKQAFADLEATDHIMEVINELEDTMTEAKAQGRDPAEIVDGLHMIFTGPPGTGKTTSAKRFGVAFKNLELLPRADVVVVTAANLLDRYVGGTGNNVIDAMRRAKGGILFIDEAYGMVPRNGSFGADAIQALLDNITTEEFKGKLIVVLGGYEKDIEQLFDVNPGFRSRFDKRRLHFPEWKASTAVSAMIKASARDRMKLTVEAEEEALRLFKILRRLPNWASARDFDTVYKIMFQKRASRLGKLLREKNAMRERSGNQTTPPGSNPKLPTGLATPLEPYEAEDVQAAFESIIKSRGGNSNQRGANAMNKSSLSRQSIIPRYDDSYYSSEGVNVSVSQRSLDDTDNIGGGGLGDRDRDADLSSRYEHGGGGGGREMGGSYGGRDGGAGGGRVMPPPAKAKFNVKVLEKKLREDGNDDDNGPSDNDIWSALEEACKELNLDLEALIKLLEHPDFPPPAILDIIMRKTGSNDKAMIGSMLKEQRPTYLKSMKEAQKEITRQKTALEENKLAKIRALGLCVAGFEWIKCEGGYRCAGGTHYCSDDEVNMMDLN